MYGPDVSSITYTITDTLKPGITGVSNIKVLLKKKGEDDFHETSIGDITSSYDSGTRTLTVNINNYKNNINGTTVYEEIKITYDAVLNENAVIEGGELGATQGNENTATLTYSKNAGGDLGTVSDTAKVFTLRLDVEKVDKDHPNVFLPEAEFTVYKADNTALEFVLDATATTANGINTYRVATSSDDPSTKTSTIISTSSVDDNKRGRIIIVGLDDQAYYLKETKAPTGYNLPPSDTKFDVNVAPQASDYNAEPKLQFDTNRQTLTITNDSGIDLPTTGGIGTIVFTAGGVLLMAGALFFLFGNKKKEEK